MLKSPQKSKSRPLERAPPREEKFFLFKLYLPHISRGYEYYYALDCARQAKELYSTYHAPHLMPIGIRSWCRDKWTDFIVGCDKFKRSIDEAYFRVSHNKERLEQMQAEKKAKELYYPGLV